MTKGEEEGVDENGNRVIRFLQYIPVINWLCNLLLRLRHSVLLHCRQVRYGICYYCKSLVCGIVKKKRDFIKSIKDCAVNLAYKVCHVIIAIGLLLLFPIMFLFVSPLYARRLIVRFQM